MDGAIDLRYRAPFLVGWLRQLAVLCDPADPPSTSRALSLVRMVDCHMVLGSQDPMGIKGLCDRLTSRILAMRQGDSTGRARLPVVDGCGLRILLDTASGERDFKEVQDPEWDALVEKLCRILEAQGLKERLPDLEGFLGKDVIDLLGPDLLAEAASPADIELARTLIKLGVDVRRPSSRGACPLVEACGAGNLELVAMLLAAGADPNAGNHSEVWPESDLLPLDTAMNGALWGPGPHGAAIVRALIRSGADPNRSGSGYGSPLRRARKAKDAALIGILTAAGARE
ncbi:MAG TPA: hypothetical protein VK188_19510 [Holophaga sp.]|nr:hypothetical protein [Holophaga sp.]